MAQYNGHRSWNAWNVSLCLNNDQGLYNLMLHCIKGTKNKSSASSKTIGIGTIQYGTEVLTVGAGS